MLAWRLGAARSGARAFVMGVNRTTVVSRVRIASSIHVLGQHPVAPPLRLLGTAVRGRPLVNIDTALDNLEAEDAAKAAESYGALLEQAPTFPAMHKVSPFALLAAGLCSSFVPSGARACSVLPALFGPTALVPVNTHQGKLVRLRTLQHVSVSPVLHFASVSNGFLISSLPLLNPSFPLVLSGLACVGQTKGQSSGLSGREKGTCCAVSMCVPCS